MSMSLAPPSARRSDLTAFLAIGITILSWSSAFVAIRYCLQTMAPLDVAAVRYLFAAVPAAAYLVFRRSPLPSRTDLGRLALIGFAWVTLYGALLNIGEMTVPAGPASFIINTMPIFVALIAWRFLGERLSLGSWFGTALSFAGVGLIALTSGDALRLELGALLILGAALSSAIAGVMQKPLLGRMEPLTLTAWLLLLGAAPYLLLAPQAASQLAQASAPTLAALVYLALVPTVIGYVTWAIALKRLTAARAANFLYGVPPTATVLGLAILGEVPSLLGLVGGAMAIGGVVVFNLLRRR